MIPTIVLDSAPLGLLTQRIGIPAADECRSWLARHADHGVQVIVPEIIDYELRRELLRANKPTSVLRLDRLISDPQIEYLRLDTVSLRLAAQLWAQARNAGTPTADAHALDIDVILAAQAMSAESPPANFVVATTNVRHLSRLVPALDWRDIK